MNAVIGSGVKTVKRKQDRKYCGNFDGDGVTKRKTDYEEYQK